MKSFSAKSNIWQAEQGIIHAYFAALRSSAMVTKVSALETIQRVRSRTIDFKCNCGG